MKKIFSAKPFVIFISVWFALSIMYGIFWAMLNTQQAISDLRDLSQSTSFIGQVSVFWVFVLIFLNNSIKGFLSLILGFLFGLAPLYFIFINGQIIGIVVYIFTLKEGLWRVLLSLAPHGIFEIPAFILASGYGLWLGYRFYRKLRYDEAFKPHFVLAMKKFAWIILPLFLVAAFVEAYITSAIVHLISKN